MLKFQGKVTDTNGNPVASARLTVSTENVVMPLPVVFTIQSDGSVLPGANPLLTDANGEYVFAIASGSYSISVTGSSSVLNISKTITQYTEPTTTTTATAVAVTLNRQVYSGTSSWTAPAGVIQATVTCVGGGGGGAGGGTVANRGGGGWRRRRSNHP